MGAEILQKVTLLSMSIASIAIGLIGIAIYNQNKKSVTHQTFLLFALGAIGWSFFNYLTFHGGSETYALWFLRLQVFFAVLYSFFLFRLFYVFPETSVRFTFTYKYLASPLALTAAALTLTPLVFERVVSISATGQIEKVANGPGLPVFGSVVILLIVAGILMLFKKMRKSTGSEKIQLKIVLIGTTITFLLHIVFNFLFPALLNNTLFAPLGAVFIAPFVLFTTYAIVKHHFLNVKVIVAEVAAAALVLFNLVQLFGASGIADLIFRAVILGFVSIFGYLLVRSVQNEVKRREEIEKLAQERSKALEELEERNRNLATLQQVSDVVLNNSNIQTMTQDILDRLPEQLDECAGGMLSIVKEKHLAAYAITQTNQFSKRIVSMVGGLEKYSFPIDESFNLLHKTLVRKNPIDSEELVDFISPPVPKSMALSIQRLLGARHVEAFPLYAGGEPFGVMMFVYTSGKDQIHTKNFEIAKAIADEMSLAIQRAQAFQKLKEANEYLAQMDKMKDEFISMASHELNTPLAAIEGYLSMILDENMGKVDAKSREYLQRAYASSKRLAELILDLLNVSRIEQGRLKMKFSQSNLVDLAESVIHELQIRADAKKIYLKVEAEKSQVPLTWCDPDRIREVFVNLTGNAIKFTDKGGVTIRVEPGANGKSIIGSITDTGRGIAKEDQKKLFQKFSQVKREVDEHQGTGLGLYISKNFVELHKGRLWVTSEAGKGATFSFELPVLDKAPVEVDGAMLEKPIGAPQIETAKKDVPAVITNSSKGSV